MTVRIAKGGDWGAEAFLTALGVTYGFDIDDQDHIDRVTELFEWDRSIVAFDGDRMIGTTGAFSLEMTVPGSTMACAGMTVVSVMPSHRRRGILRQMMDTHLADARERGEPIGGLWSADSSIYGRFGYGAASFGVDLKIRRENSEFARLAPPPSPVRLVSADEAARMLPPFYARAQTEIPGHYARSEKWWRLRSLSDVPVRREGATSYRFGVTESSGEVDGYVQYRFKESWDEGHGQGSVIVTELLGSSPESWAGLWRFVLDHDLMAVVSAEQRSIEDPIFDLLAGRRRALVTELRDGLWIRILDTKRALEGRAYSDTAQTVVEIHDPLDDSTTTWRLDLSRDGAEVTRTDAEPDVRLDLEDLGACFMGWSRFQNLARSGRLTGDPDHLAALDRTFTWSPSPWAADTF